MTSSARAPRPSGSLRSEARAKVFYSSTQTPISPICRAPLFPISQNSILCFSNQGCFAGRITTLNLRRNNLTGHLNLEDLGELTNLTYLDLSFNQLSGSIPTQIGQIDNLQMMNLAHNELSGTLPSELGALNSGAPPVSMGCGLDDPCPLGVQLRLTELNLAHNRIEGDVPTELGKLESLKVFLFAHAPISPICRNPLFPYLTF